MKRLALCILLMLTCALVNAQGFSIYEDLTIVSSYLYHGKYLGGLSFQPHVKASYYGFYGDLWWNIGATNYTFQKSADEFDIKIGYNNYGAKIEYKHVSPISELNCFNYNKSSAYGLVDLGYDFNYFHIMPLSILTCTRVTGKNIGNMYIELKSSLKFHYGLSLEYAMGMNTDFKTDLLVICLEAKLSKSFSGNIFNYSAYVQGMFNPYNVSKDNLITHDYNQHLNGCIGIIIALK